MIELVEINEQNWLDYARLSVSEEQKAYLDSAVGILARAYAYRTCRANAIGIAAGGRPVGLALVKDLDEEPACYDLQQFMIDKSAQNQGYGTQALCLVLDQLRQERKYEAVEVCVHRLDAAALRVYEKLGFFDTGYVEETLPDFRNLRHLFRNETP